MTETVSDGIKRRAFQAAAPFFDDAGGDHFDAVRAVLEAVAPLLRASGMREAAEMTFWSCVNGIKADDYGLRDAILARAAEMEKKTCSPDPEDDYADRAEWKNKP